VGTFGLSYPGAVQWLAAIESPPHLKAMVPAMTFSTPRNFFYSGGAFDASWIDWIWFNIAPDIRAKKNLPGPKTYKEAAAAWKTEHERLQNFLPLRNLPDFKEVAPFYYEWLAHPPADPWWDWAELRGKYDRVHCAVLNISGWYDEAYGPDGATTNFNGLLAARKGEKDPRTQTIIGAWTHGELERTKAGDVDFGADAKVDYDEIILRWMDHYLKGIENRVEREGPVQIFVMGSNRWRDEITWPLKRAVNETYSLTRIDPATRIGGLTRGPSNSSEYYSEFVSDPSHPVRDPYEEFGARDYNSLAGRKDVLVFDSETLEQDTEVTGPIQATIYASADVPDFDLWVRVLDVWPDGRVFNLMSPGLDVLRGSYRNGSLKPELLTSGTVYKLQLDHLLTSNIFKKDHKIRLQISGAFAPHFTRNLQTGESEITTSKTQVGHIHIYQNLSTITLPIIPR
jgi:putative CocE/NonD family hydrolase